jgi:pterin-4a-carbinolamine dehydratase
MNAKEAREKAQSLQSIKVSEDYNKCKKAISAAVDFGRFDTSLGFINQSALALLQKEGYKITTGSDRNESYTQINW